MEIKNKQTGIAPIAIILVVLIVGIGGGVVYFAGKNKAEVAQSPSPTPTVTNDGQMMDGEMGNDEMMEEKKMMEGSEGMMGEGMGMKEFMVNATPFQFSMKEIRVKKGETVKVVFNNQQGMHDWVVDEFAGARTKVLQAGQSETIEFVADKAGTFDYYCSVGNHRQMGMAGKLIVE